MKTPYFVKEFEDALERETDWVLQRGGSRKAVEFAKQRLFSSIVKQGRSWAAGIPSEQGQASFLRALDDWHFAHRAAARFKREKALSKASVLRVLKIHCRNASASVEQADKTKLSQADVQRALKIRGLAKNLFLQVKSGEVESGDFVSNPTFKRGIRQLPDSTFGYRLSGRGIPDHIPGQLALLAKLHGENVPFLSASARTMRAAKGFGRPESNALRQRKG